MAAEHGASARRRESTERRSGSPRGVPWRMGVPRVEVHRPRTSSDVLTRPVCPGPGIGRQQHPPPSPSAVIPPPRSLLLAQELAELDSSQRAIKRIGKQVVLKTPKRTEL